MVFVATLKVLRGGEIGLRVATRVDLKGAIYVGERALRLWLIALTVALTFTVFSVIALWRSRFEFLRVGRLEVISQGGKTSVVVGSNANGDGVIMLYDGKGVLRAAIGVTSAGDAAIDLFDGSGIQRVPISVKVDGKVTIKGF